MWSIVFTWLQVSLEMIDVEDMRWSAIKAFSVIRMYVCEIQSAHIAGSTISVRTIYTLRP